MLNILYGSFLTLFLLSFLAEAVFFRLRFTNKAKGWLYAILVVYLGYPFLGYLLPLLDINNSTKRGLFKLFPLMSLYLANNQLYGKLSAWLNRLHS